VNSQKLYLSTGDYIILLPNDEHSLKAKQGIRFYSIEFTMQESFLNHYLYNDIKNVFARPADSPVSVYKNSSLKSLLENMFKEWKTREPLYISYITLLFQQILIQCSRLHMDNRITDTEEGHRGELVLEYFLSFIEAYMDKPDVLALYEQNYGIKRTTLTRISKEIFGKTVFQLYTDKRFEYALSLLADGSLSVSQIAQRCAFSSVAAFSKAFTHYYGVSPSKYLSDHPNVMNNSIGINTVFSAYSGAVREPVELENKQFQYDNNEEYSNPKLKLI
jgi:AraC-like DNA-binding protein